MGGGGGAVSAAERPSRTPSARRGRQRCELAARPGGAWTEHPGESPVLPGKAGAAGAGAPRVCPRASGVRGRGAPGARSLGKVTPGAALRSPRRCPLPAARCGGPAGCSELDFPGLWAKRPRRDRAGQRLPGRRTRSRAVGARAGEADPHPEPARGAPGRRRLPPAAGGRRRLRPSRADAGRGAGGGLRGGPGARGAGARPRLTPRRHRAPPWEKSVGATRGPATCRTSLTPRISCLRALTLPGTALNCWIAPGVVRLLGLCAL